MQTGSKLRRQYCNGSVRDVTSLYYKLADHNDNNNEKLKMWIFPQTEARLNIYRVKPFPPPQFQMLTVILAFHRHSKCLMECHLGANSPINAWNQPLSYSSSMRPPVKGTSVFLN